MDNTNNISALSQNVASKQSTKARVVAAIKTASAKTGVDFSYLMNKASQESSFNPEAKAAKSSATGLYQFIDQTWLRTIKENGAEYGLASVAEKISVGSDGIARVANEADKKAILALRKDPEVSALMAAELAKDNRDALQKTVGGKVGATEMYMAHFLGSGGAANLLNQMKANPDAIAADVVPSAAAANKSVFYDSETGEAKTVGEIYQTFAQKFDKAPDISGTETKVALAATTSDTNASVIENALATNMTLASIAQSTNTVSLSNGLSLHQSISSPFATMVLAQMDMETFGIQSKADTGSFGSKDETRRKSALDALAHTG